MAIAVGDALFRIRLLLGVIKERQRLLLFRPRAKEDAYATRSKNNKCSDEHRDIPKPSTDRFQYATLHIKPPDTPKLFCTMIIRAVKIFCVPFCDT